jgi:hypothetical protein
LAGPFSSLSVSERPAFHVKHRAAVAMRNALLAVIDV